LGLDGRRRIGLARCLKGIQGDNDTAERRDRFDEFLQYVGYCIRVETTSLMELATWRMKLEAMHEELLPEGDINCRRMARVQCSLEVLVENVTEYLWGDESKQLTALSLFPLIHSSHQT